MGCASNHAKDPIQTIAGESPDIVRWKLGKPVTSGVLKGKDIRHEVYWQIRDHNKVWSIDRSAWVVLYRGNAGAEVHEGFDDLEPDVRAPIKKAYDLECRKRLENSLQNNRGQPHQ